MTLRYLVVSTIILVFLCLVVAFWALEERVLDRWAMPAKSGEYVVAMRMERGNRTEFNNTIERLRLFIGSGVLSGEGHGVCYQRWRNSGWCRINRKCRKDLSYQVLVNQAASCVMPGMRICIVDEKGKIYYPEAP